jgi:glutathione peroxidase
LKFEKESTMRLAFLSVAVAAALVGAAAADDDASVLRHTYTSIDGEKTPMSKYRGKVILVVNTASQCGYTAQYKDLEALYKRYKGKGLVVLGFPCNDFGGQEPGTEASIKTFCEERFKVSFPMSAKVKVKGADKAPLYKDLTEQAGEARWNFTKYLIDREGKILGSFGSSAKPLGKKLTAAIESALESPKASDAKSDTGKKGK